MRSSYVLKLKLALGGLATIAATLAAQEARSAPPRPVTRCNAPRGLRCRRRALRTESVRRC